MMSSSSSHRKPLNSASSNSGSRVTPVFSYTVKCSKQCAARCSSAPLVQVVRRPSARASSCRVLNSHKRSLSPPLSNFVYDYTQKAYSNREGFTWTPMYLQHCPKPFVFTEIKNQDWDHVKPRKIFVPFSVANRNASKSSWQACCGTAPPPDGNSRRVTTYSKFMESPYINRRLCSKLVNQYVI